MLPINSGQPRVGKRMQKFAMNRQSLLRVLLGVYLFPLWLVVFSLGVPPSDFQLCVLMFILALSGFALARHERRAWRTIWTAGLIIAIVCGVLEVVAGKRNAARQRSEHRSASYSEIGESAAAEHCRAPASFTSSLL